MFEKKEGMKLCVDVDASTSAGLHQGGDVSCPDQPFNVPVPGLRPQGKCKAGSEVYPDCQESK